MKCINIALVFVLLSFGILNVFAQTTQATILGRIESYDDAPQIKSKVKIVNESTGFSSETLTNLNGEYIFKEIPLGGPYRIFVDEQFRKEVNNINLGEQLVVNIKLTDTKEKNIKEVVVIGNLKNKVGNIGAATVITSKNISVLPVNGRSFTSLTELSPLSGKNGNLSGQLASSTNYTIDGMTAKNPTSAGSTTSRSDAPYSISIEAVREFKITTNQYDVTLGRSGGGTITAVTKSGTNTLVGSVFQYQRAGWLNSGYDIRGNRIKNDFSTYQFGFSLGGPLVKNKLHFFMAWDHQLDSKPLIIADVRSREDELRLNITNETLNKVLEIGRKKYGISNTPQFGIFDRTRNSDAGFLRFDWQINPKNLLILRNNFTHDFNKNGLADNTNINFYESYGNDKNWDNSLLLTLRSNFSLPVTNELKFQHLYTFQNTFQNEELGHSVPRAIVEHVNSVIQGQKDLLQTNIQFGGHRFAQESFKNNVYQLVNNLYYNRDKLKYTFGVDLMYTWSQSIYGSELNGRFHFDGIENLRDMISYRYYREVPLLDDSSIKSSIWNLGMYAQVMAKISRGLNFTAGLRFDYGAYPKAKLNQKLFDEMGIRTDNKIKSYVIQPRVQFDWNIGENHKDFIKFGGGVFSSDINNYMLINNLYFDGLHSATVDVNPIEVGFTPDFINYRKDYLTIPSLKQYQLPTINYTGKNVKIPIVYKFNISYTHFFTEMFRIGISGYVAFGRNNYFYYDRNMVDKPFFRLENEEYRGVFVPEDKINITNGSSNWLDGRINKNFGRVMELVSDGKVNQYSFVFDTSYRYYKDGEFTASYTWADIQDNTSYNGNVANSAILSTMVSSDPRNLRMAYSDNHFRHKFVLYGNTPTIEGFIVGVRYSGIGGTRFSMTAGGNINGDFVNSNDLAYVFPDLTSSLLSDPNVGKALKNYIRKYSNKIARRNGGVNGFYGIWDIRIAKKLKFEKLRNLEFSVDIFNFANLLNKKWGINESYGNTSLYKVKGFDPVAKKFSYSLNTKGLPPLSGKPYQIQIGVKFTF